MRCVMRPTEKNRLALARSDRSGLRSGFSAFDDPVIAPGDLAPAVSQERQSCRRLTSPFFLLFPAFVVVAAPTHALATKRRWTPGQGGCAYSGNCRAETGMIPENSRALWISEGFKREHPSRGYSVVSRLALRNSVRIWSHPMRRVKSRATPDATRLQRLCAQRQ